MLPKCPPPQAMREKESGKGDGELHQSCQISNLHCRREFNMRLKIFEATGMAETLCLCIQDVVDGVFRR